MAVHGFMLGLLCQHGTIDGRAWDHAAAAPSSLWPPSSHYRCVGKLAYWEDLSD